MPEINQLFRQIINIDLLLSIDLADEHAFSRRPYVAIKNQGG